ncbi:hypothetical protein ACI2LO_07150 [Streptomyces sp. NPDC033754]|uniref:hypothetical protein n=1 Tax=unclassified Streptomyces TaxID=2593676 RepID=UPI0033E7DC43
MVVTREDEVLARAAVEGLLAGVELTPKPGLPDGLLSPQVPLVVGGLLVPAASATATAEQ